MNEIPDRRAHYMLRRNLPLWKPQSTIDETIDFCGRAQVGEIIWKIDPEDFNHAFTPLEMLAEFVHWLKVARDQQSAHGIVFSINPWLTLNHIGRNRYGGVPPAGFSWKVTPTGEVADEMACPLCAAWRKWLVEAYRLHATTRPDKLWMEDDFKTFAHQSCFVGCYCPDHLAAFSARVGEEFTREALVERMLRPGEPDPIRAAWYDFQGEIMVGICRDVEKAVHAESPSTRLGLMQSWSTDGRWWHEAVMTLAGPHRPLTRTSLAGYVEERATSFLPDAFDHLKEVWCVPANAENCPELENSLYTPYSKSMRTTRLQIIMSQVLGNDSITMNLFDMLGSPTCEDPRVGKMLADTKAFIDGIARFAGPGGTRRGVSVPYDKKFSDKLHLSPGQGFEAFGQQGDAWCAPIQASGSPVFLNEEAVVTAMTAQQIRALGDKRIRDILSHGALLDGSAAALLQEMGYGELVGASVGESIGRYEVLISAERDDWAPEGTSADPVYMTLRNVANPCCGRFYKLTPFETARVVSTFVDPDHKAVGPCFTVFENGLGGRVAVYPFDFSTGVNPGFMNWRRRRQLQRILRWLGQDGVDLFADGGAWMMPVRKDYADYTFIAILNFETDDWDELKLTFQHDAEISRLRFAVLDHDGAYRPIQARSLARDGGNVVAEFERHVPALDAAVFLIRW